MLSALVVLAAAVAAPNAAELASFKVGDKAFSMPVPEGYCQPTGDLAVFDQRVASADPDNVTLASFYACAREPAVIPIWEYVYIKVPNSMLGANVGKAETLAALRDVFTRPDAPTFDQAMTDKISAGYNDAMGIQVEVQGNWGYIGSDADCVYLGGTLAAQVKGKAKPISGATCLSVVGGKVLAVNVYADPKAASVAELQRRSRAMTLTIRAN